MTTITLADNFPKGFVARPVSAIDGSSSNPTVILEWDSGNIGPYKQVDNTPANNVFLTELILTASADKSKTGGDETFVLENGALVSGFTNRATYDTTRRGVSNSETEMNGSTDFSVNYKEHAKDSI